jgi:hypothetical protein
MKKKWEQVYDESWERPHTPTNEIDWQESDWFTTFDPKAGLGVTYRIGQEFNKKTCNANLTVFTLDGGRFKMEDLGGRGKDHALRPEDRWETGYQADGHRVESLGDSRIRYSWKYPETEGDIEFCEPFYTPRYWTNDDRDWELLDTIHPGGHLESGGRIRGAIRLGDRTFNVDWKAHRDRSWGNRPNYFARLERWKCAWGAIGPEFSYAAQLLKPRNGPPAATVGFVARNGKTAEVIDWRLIGTIDLETNRGIGGTVVLTLESGEVIRVEADFAQPVDGGFEPDTRFGGTGTITFDGQVGFSSCSYSGNVAKNWKPTT